MEHKRIGAGRDARLTSFSTASAGPTVLFHQVVATCDKNYKLPFKIFGESPAALPEVIDGMLASGMEPHTFAASYIAALGLGKQSALAVEVQNIVHALFFYCCVDKLNPFRSSTLDHFGRRLLQITAACRKQGKSPDFDGLDDYMLHATSGTMGIRAPVLSKFIGEQAKTNAAIMKQLRLSHEENDLDSKKKQKEKEKDKDKKGKGGGKDE